MEREHLWKSLFVLGIVLVMISFSKGILSSENGGILIYDTSAYRGHLFQCLENPYLIVDVQNDRLISLYFMSIEESFRFIDGTPIENVTIVFSLVNISEYSGPVDLGSPGLYVLFITTFNQSESTIEYDYLGYSMTVFRETPQLRVLGTGFVFIIFSVLVLFHSILASRRVEV